MIYSRAFRTKGKTVKQVCPKIPQNSQDITYITSEWPPLKHILNAIYCSPFAVYTGVKSGQRSGPPFPNMFRRVIGELIHSDIVTPSSIRSRYSIRDGR